MIYTYILTIYSLNILDAAIRSSTIAAGFIGLSATGSEVKAKFTVELTFEERQVLDALVSSHQAAMPTSFDYNVEASKISQDLNIDFGRQLLQDWMRRNVNQGMSIIQSLWVFSRFEEFTISIGGQPRHVDIFKMFQSGAIPTVYYCVLRIQPDDMTQPYHWVTQERINWVKGQLEARLGAGMVAYIQSLS